MVIDMHVHPILYNMICDDEAALKYRSEQFGIFKQSPYQFDEIFTEMDYGKIDKSVLLPEDLTSISGGTIVSNEEIKKIVELHPERFIGFASVDPHRKDALEVLEYAFHDLKLNGLKLNPSKQLFYPNDKELKPIYEKCIQYNKPVLFHAGMSWEPNAPVKYSLPVNFDEVAAAYPNLRICLAHFGWPWIKETIMLMIKYPNVYTDTSMLYLDSPKDFIESVFKREMGSRTMETNFGNQVMFGSNTPRFRAFKLKSAIECLELSDSMQEKLLGLNAIKFLGLEG
jgi:uncharacterized protein